MSSRQCWPCIPPCSSFWLGSADKLRRQPYGMLLTCHGYHSMHKGPYTLFALYGKAFFSKIWRTSNRENAPLHSHGYRRNKRREGPNLQYSVLVYRLRLLGVNYSLDPLNMKNAFRRSDHADLDKLVNFKATEVHDDANFKQRYLNATTTCNSAGAFVVFKVPQGGVLGTRPQPSFLFFLVRSNR